MLARILALLFVHTMSPNPIASAQRVIGMETLQPERYTSHSGTVELFVDPVTRYGHDSARYELRREGKLMWASEKPFALWEAAVSERGVTIGYAYSKGPNGGREDGNFRVVVLGDDGTVLNEVVEDREPSGMFHAPPVPIARSTFVHDELGRGIVDLVDKGANQPRKSMWWVFDLETGEALERVRPVERQTESAPLTYLVDAQPVHDRPLTLLHWYRHEGTDRGARFTLVDATWRPVWRLDLPTDYNTKRYEGPEYEFASKIQRNGAVLSTQSEGLFELCFVAERKRVSFQVKLDAGDWKAVETRRADYVDEQRVPVAIPSIDLKLIDAVNLGAAEKLPTGPIRDIVEFAPDHDGTVRFVRREGAAGQFTIVRLDSIGELENETPVDRIEHDGRELSEGWAPLSTGDWLYTVSEFGDGGKSRAWIVDADSGELNELEDFDCPFVEEVAATADGGFAMIAAYKGKYSSTDVLMCFDATGKKLWEVGNQHGDETKLFSPEDLTVTTRGLVVVLENVANVLRVYRGNGEFVRVVDLEKSFGAEPSYPSGISPDVDGGVLIHDFDGAPPLWRLSVGGTVRSKFDAVDDGGHTAGGLARNTQVGPDGVMWATDGRVLVQLDEGGAVTRVFGDATDPDRLYEPGAASVDGRGHVLIQDSRTANVHVFDASGDRLRVCRASRSDLAAASTISRLTSSSDGSVFVELDDFPRQSFAHFAPDGSRVGVRKFPSESFAFVAEGEQCWALDERGLLLVNGDDSIARSIERLPDNRFFERGQVAVANDGTIAFHYWGGLALFDTTGAATRMIPLEDDRFYGAMSWSGRWIAIGAWDAEAWLIDTRDGARYHFKFEARSGRETSWRRGFSPDGKELWFVDSRVPKLYRFELP